MDAGRARITLSAVMPHECACSGLAAVPPWVLLAAVFLLPALEASTLLGLVVPGRRPCC
jgi:hypothetical protein